MITAGRESPPTRDNAPPGRTERGADSSEAGNLKSNRITTRGRIKKFIVRSALLGMIPFRLGDWLIQRGGLRHD